MKQIISLFSLMLLACGGTSGSENTASESGIRVIGHVIPAAYVVFGVTQAVAEQRIDRLPYDTVATAKCDHTDSSINGPDLVVGGTCYGTNLAVTITEGVGVPATATEPAYWKCSGHGAYVRADGFLTARAECMPQ